MKKFLVPVIIFIIIITIWFLGLCFLTQNLDWRLPNNLDEMAKLWDSFWIFNALFSSLALWGAIYAIYHQLLEFETSKRDRQIADQRHRKSIEPKLAITHEIKDLESTTPLFEIYVVDKNNMMKRPSVVEVSGTLNGLEIHKQNEEKYRIAARVDKDKNSILRLIYQDIEWNHYAKDFSCTPYSEKDVN